MFTRICTFLAFLLPFSACAITIPGDASRGAQVFRSQKCIVCHSINGDGGKLAPDLARKPIADYSPSIMAEAIWNHGPRMWSAMEKAGVTVPRITTGEA